MNKYQKILNLLNSQTKIERNSYHKATTILPYADSNVPFTLGSFDSKNVSQNMDYNSHSILLCNNVSTQNLSIY